MLQEVCFCALDVPQEAAVRHQGACRLTSSAPSSSPSFCRAFLPPRGHTCNQWLLYSNVLLADLIIC